jgi:DNA-binding CsgD family transcriptional regulator
VERLRLRDLRSINRFLATLYELADVVTLRQRLLRTLPALIPSDRVAVFEFGRPYGISGESLPGGAFSSELARLHARYLPESPMLAAYQRGDGSAIKLTDFLTQRELRKRALYTEYLRRLDIEYIIAKGLPGPPDRLTTLVLDRKTSDFSERERLVLNVLRPHLNQSYRNAVAVTASRERIGALEAGVETLERGVVLLGADGGVQWAPALARRWFTMYFGAPHGAPGELPEPVSRWLRAHGRPGADDVTAPRAPLVVRRQHTELVVRLVWRGPHALLLVDEQYLSIPPEALRALGLTRREAEVLAWVAEGKTSDEIGIILGVSRRAVEKHLEHIYPKLGVETRTAAAARALDFVKGR